MNVATFDAFSDGSYLVVVLVALGGALWVRPWRSVGRQGPPWPWVACWALLPLSWGLDRWTDSALVQPLSCVPLLVLMAGWPLTMLAMLPATLVMVLVSGLGWQEGLHRLVWLGLMPAAAGLWVGWLVRRWLPHHLFVYILARAFLGTWLVMGLIGALRYWSEGRSAVLSAGDLILARLLTASGEAVLTGMVVAIFVAFRPQWLATYSDRLYLPTTRP
jgi:uncharacterized membrane protein